VLSGRVRDPVADLVPAAPVLVGVGQGVDPAGYGEIDALVALLGAELVGTRKVTDRGWLPKTRQIGVTGHAVAPRLYVAIGLSGKFNHTIGVRRAGTVLAINADPAAPIFDAADIGIVGDWREVVAGLAAELAERVGTAAGSPERARRAAAGLGERGGRRGAAATAPSDGRISLPPQH